MSGPRHECLISPAVWAWLEQVRVATAEVMGVESEPFWFQLRITRLPDHPLPGRRHGGRA